MQLHELKRAPARKGSRRVGRGGKRGKMSGGGHKGQTARAGGRPRTEMRDIIKRLPKLRGHGVNRAEAVNAERVRPVVVNLDRIEAAYSAGETVSPSTLFAKGLLEQARKKHPPVKILARGSLTKSLTVSGCEVSESAKAAIVAAGGSVQ